MRSGSSEGFFIVICAARAGAVSVTVTGEMSIGAARAGAASHSAQPTAISVAVSRRTADRIEFPAGGYGPKLNVKVTVSKYFPAGAVLFGNPAVGIAQML